jgi:hypothetical protein
MVLGAASPRTLRLPVLTLIRSYPLRVYRIAPLRQPVRGRFVCLLFCFVPPELYHVRRA